jgi:hypothetical protein
LLLIITPIAKQVHRNQLHINTVKKGVESPVRNMIGS